MPNKILHLIRHAEVGLEYRSRYLGRSDIPLSNEGIKQAQELGSEFSKILGSKLDELEVWLSPLKRCALTWEEMAITPKNPPSIIPDLAEIDFGQWEGKDFHEIVKSHPEEVTKWGKFDPEFSFPNGESLANFQERMERLRRETLTCSQQNLVLVTHGGVASSLLCLFLGLEPSQYLIFELARPSIATLTLFKNGLGRLSGLRSIASRKAGEWPG